jgi:hypothetical protein
VALIRPRSRLSRVDAALQSARCRDRHWNKAQAGHERRYQYRRNYPKHDFAAGTDKTGDLRTVMQFRKDREGATKAGCRARGARS